MTADAMAKNLGMNPHIEHGRFVENHYPPVDANRQASGSIYYYLARDEYSLFHRIDCDEYWIFHTGSPLEVWLLSPAGELSAVTMGLEPGQTPSLYIPKGTVFASRHRGAQTDGTMLTCVTVPRFTYEGFELLPREDAVALDSRLARFFDGLEEQ